MKDINYKAAKRAYHTPQLIRHGSIEEITLGSGFGIRDLFVFGTDDVIGNCDNNSCNTNTGS
jgi:hypothetical protein